MVVPTLFLVTIIVFAVVRMIPGDVINSIMSDMAHSADLGSDVRELIRRKLGLDLPVHVQYGRWIGGVLQGDLGVSLRGEVPIAPRKQLRHHFGGHPADPDWRAGLVFCQFHFVGCRKLGDIYFFATCPLIFCTLLNPTF